MKLMITKGITKKLFLITFLFLFLFLLVTLLFQRYFFGEFYKNSKMNDFKKTVTEFNNYITSNDFTRTILDKNIEYFGEKYNSKIAIIKRDGSSLILTLPSEMYKDSFYIMCSTIINDPDLLNQIREQTETTVHITDENTYNVKNIICISPNKNGDVFIAATSFQPVEEAGNVINRFYFYIFIGALIIIIILSIVYSKMISKPLIKLNKSAKDYSKLDFSKKIDYKHNDEIGDLATTLNFLSVNLEKSMNELRVKNAKLQEDIEREREMEAIRKDFVVSVSHELKTPISLIYGYAEGLKDNINSESKDFYLDVILDETNKMNQLVKDMLELSTLESKNYSLKIETFKFDELLKKHLKNHNNLVKDKDLKLDIKDDVLVKGDMLKIEEVLTNFLTNAVTHTNDEGSIRITLKEEGDKAIYEIENEGPKISDEDLLKIWNKFYKADKSRNRSLGGTGLGLSIVKNILELHESEFGCLNTENGVMFYFSLNKVK